jgi:hypothetical protein
MTKRERSSTAHRPRGDTNTLRGKKWLVALLNHSVLGFLKLTGSSQTFLSSSMTAYFSKCPDKAPIWFSGTPAVDDDVRTPLSQISAFHHKADPKEL